MRRLVLTSLLLLLALAPRARARGVDQDFQVWAPVVLQATYRPVRLWVEVQPRMIDDAGRLGFMIYRPALAWLTPVEGLSLWGGYAFVERVDRRYTREHRAWQQVQYDHTIEELGRLRFIHRLRAEQRFLQDRDPVAHRLRWLLRGSLPLAFEGRLMAIGWNEFFFNVNTVEGGPRRGFDQNRTFFGPGVQVTRWTRVEVGYLAQYFHRVRAEDDLNHVLFASLWIDLP
ncbi:MAG: DUF2490 domain-containing protein [Planctomycetes bacterium]|nr:DUF2490 domain-containing protein [Planctomycetota bacterium]